MSIKPKGGRGKKAPYTTIQMRVPLEIKDDVNTLIESYRVRALTGNSMEAVQGQDLVKNFLESWKAKSDSQSPTNQRWQWAREMIQELEGILSR
jgi:hypothetical protein